MDTKTQLTVGHWVPTDEGAAAPKDCVGCSDDNGKLQKCDCDGPPAQNTAGCRGHIGEECNATCVAPFERLDVDGGWPFSCTKGGWRGGVARCGTKPPPRRHGAAGGENDGDDGGDNDGNDADRAVPLWLVGLLIVVALAVGFIVSTLCRKKREVDVRSLTDALTNSDSFGG
jgi:hypothetical protein